MPWIVGCGFMAPSWVLVAMATARRQRGRPRQTPLTMQRSGTARAPRADMGRGEVVGSAAFWKQKRTLMAEEIARFDHDKTKLRTYAAETLGIDLSRRVPVVEDQRTILYTLRARLD